MKALVVIIMYIKSLVVKTISMETLSYRCLQNLMNYETFNDIYDENVGFFCSSTNLGKFTYVYHLLHNSTCLHNIYQAFNEQTFKEQRTKNASFRTFLVKGALFISNKYNFTYLERASIKSLMFTVNNDVEYVRCLLPEESSDKYEIICNKSRKCKQSSITITVLIVKKQQMEKDGSGNGQ
jgi:hypothetical protein